MEPETDDENEDAGDDICVREYLIHLQPFRLPVRDSQTGAYEPS
jgi:hypothetical protein